MGLLNITAKASRAINSRPATIVLVVLGIVACILLFPRLYADGGISRKEALGEAVVVFVPLLFAKLLNLLLLSFSDFALSRSPEKRITQASTAKAKARIFRILAERKNKYCFLDSVTLGSERHLLSAARKIAKAFGANNEPPSIIMCEDPFVLIRVSASWRPGTHEECTMLHMHSSDARGHVLSKLISSSLETA
ncbi:MAG: hypothetical protein V1708_03160 [Candidatus Micrarchaeota archaeon]